MSSNIKFNFLLVLGYRLQKWGYYATPNTFGAVDGGERLIFHKISSTIWRI